MKGINLELQKYIEEQILPLYDNNIGGHGISHIKFVIERSFELINEFKLNLNLNMVYTIAVFHDIKITREQKMRLRELIRLAKRENREGVHNGIFYIDLYDEKGVSATGKLNINTLSVSEIVEYIEFQKIS